MLFTSTVTNSNDVQNLWALHHYKRLFELYTLILISPNWYGIRCVVVRCKPMMHVYDVHAMRYTPMRCTPIRYTPVRYTPMRCTPVRYTPMRCTPARYAHEVHTCEMHACEVHAMRYTPMRCTPVRCTPMRYTPVIVIRLVLNPEQLQIYKNVVLTAKMQVSRCQPRSALENFITATRRILDFEQRLLSNPLQADIPPPLDQHQRNVPKSLSSLVPANDFVLQESYEHAN